MSGRLSSDLLATQTSPPILSNLDQQLQRCFRQGSHALFLRIKINIVALSHSTHKVTLVDPLIDGGQTPVRERAIVINVAQVPARAGSVAFRQCVATAEPACRGRR